MDYPGAAFQTSPCLICCSVFIFSQAQSLMEPYFSNSSFSKLFVANKNCWKFCSTSLKTSLLLIKEFLIICNNRAWSRINLRVLALDTQFITLVIFQMPSRLRSNQWEQRNRFTMTDITWHMRSGAGEHWARGLSLSVLSIRYSLCHYQYWSVLLYSHRSRLTDPESTYSPIRFLVPSFRTVTANNRKDGSIDNCFCERLPILAQGFLI